MYKVGLLYPKMLMWFRLVSPIDVLGIPWVLRGYLYMYIYIYIYIYIFVICVYINMYVEVEQGSTRMHKDYMGLKQGFYRG